MATYSTSPNYMPPWIHPLSGTNPIPPWIHPVGTLASPAPAAAPAPPPPPPTPVFDPYLDPGYAGTANAQQNINTHALGEHDYQYGNIAQTTGYDSSGNLISDPSNPNFNPYAAAAVLKKHFDDTTRGTTNSYAAQGQLYSGALNNAQDTNTYNYGLSSDQLQRGAAGQYHGADTTYQGVVDTGQMTLAQLLGPALQAFLASQRGS